MRRLPLAPPRDPRADAYPMPRVPTGWYGIALSREVSSRRPTSLHYFGRELVAFRDTSGTAHLIDAYCPHYGAHLGDGGRIVDGTLECPFHGWRFDGGGRCVHAPFADKPPRAQTGSYPTVERSGVLYAFVGAETPTFEAPDIPEGHDRDYASPMSERHVARTHVQEIRENIVDESHFHFIHGQRRPSELVFEEDGPRAYVHGTLHKRVLGVDFEQSFEVEMHGPGVMIVRTAGRYMTTTTVALTTPIDDRASELHLLHYIKRAELGRVLVPFQKLFFNLVAGPEIREERRIWDAKIWRERPILLPHETGIRALRRWYAQFYASADEEDAIVSPHIAAG